MVQHAARVVQRLKCGRERRSSSSRVSRVEGVLQEQACARARVSIWILTALRSLLLLLLLLQIPLLVLVRNDSLLLQNVSFNM